MLKILGIGLILAVSFLYGWQLKQNLAEHVKQLIMFKEILLMLSGEMSYAKTPLEEAFRHISRQGKEPYGKALLEISQKMEQEREKTLAVIWKDTLKTHRDSFLLTGEEFELLTGLGENFGYLDVTMQLNHLALTLQQVEAKIVQAQQELLGKQKMYQYLSVMCGLFLILLLI